MKKLSAILLVLALLISAAACTNNRQGGSSSSSDAPASDKSALVAKISESRPLIYGTVSEQTRKYLKGALDRGDYCVADAKCSDKEMNNAIADIDYAVSILKAGDFTTVFTDDLSSYSSAERATAPDGTENSLKFTDSFASAAGVNPFNGKLSRAVGIGMRFCAEAPQGDMTVTLKSGETLFSAVLPQPVSAGDLHISFDYFVNEGGAFIEDYLSAMDGFAIDTQGVCYISALIAYDERLETSTAPLSVRTASSISNEKFYKIIEPKKGNVLTFGPELTETATLWPGSLVMQDDRQNLSFSEDTDSVSQLWQLYRTESGKYRIINKGTGLALTSDLKQNLSCAVHDMTSAKQEFGITSKSGGNFVINYVDAFSLAPMSAKAVLKDGTSSTVRLVEYDYGAWEMVKADEFDGTELDRTMWIPDDGKTRADTEPIYYRDNPNNHYIENGNLVIKSIIEEYKGYHATSASISTAGTYGISYGRVDVRAKLPKGTSIWPAIWMMGVDALWPHDGEIDIMESGWIGVNASDAQKSESEHLHGTLHWFDDSGIHVSKNNHFLVEKSSKLYDEYHVYSLEWDEEQIRLLVDGMQYMSLLIKNDSMRWGFGDHPHYLILNTSVSGPGNDELPEGMPATSEYYIDYVRFYKRESETSHTDELRSDAAHQMVSLGVSGTNEAVTSPDGKYTAAIGWSNTITIFDAKKGEKLTEVTGDGSVYTSLAFSPDSSLLVAGSRDGKLSYVDFNDDFICWTVDNSHVYHDSVAFTADGAYLLAGGRNFDDASSYSRKLSVFDRNGGRVKDISLSSDIRSIKTSGGLIALALGNGTVQLYGATDLALYATLTGHTSAVRGLAFSPDGSKLASSDENGNIIVWDTASRKQQIKMDNTCSASVPQLLFSADGRRVIAASNSGDVRIFTVSTGRLYSLMGGFDSLVRSIAISPDGSLIAACGYDGKVKTYRSDGTYLETMDASGIHGCWVETVAFGSNKILYFGMPNPVNNFYGWRLSKS